MLLLLVPSYITYDLNSKHFEANIERKFAVRTTDVLYCMLHAIAVLCLAGFYCVAIVATAATTAVQFQFSI